ncbi:hypothetical protein NEFER03_0851 [Nematocida sp. LUAm3]|nr:hypothetical protein NEFER03_0851 [Nematocida sp. LUAm3]KAI5174869.1 hypothetical protein NEFER02_0969 [Nematocida sp. LUAm2]KAI5177533.1 hypothetical protein NEFER01_0783 [Nematocida sp. LUAm1]
MQRKKKVHWRATYLKRIHSTEITVRRSLTEERRKSVPELTRSVSSFHEEKDSPIERTPERLANTPIKTISYVNPQEELEVPPTPGTHFASGSSSFFAPKKRLFW